MFELNFAATHAADHVVMIFPCDLISGMSVAGVGRMNQSVFGEEIERPINRRLGETRQVASRLFEDFTGRKMRPRVMENVQDCHSLGRHSISAGAELGSIHGCAGHGSILIASFCNNYLNSRVQVADSYPLALLIFANDEVAYGSQKNWVRA